MSVVKMTIDDARKVIENEIACVIRSNNCNHNCSKCDLVKKDKDVLTAYAIALSGIRALSHDLGPNYVIKADVEPGMGAVIRS